MPAPGDNDYVAGPDLGIDYTAQDIKDDNPLMDDDVDIESEGIEGDYLPGVTGDDIAKTTFRNFPPGKHVGRIKSFEWLKNTKTGGDIFIEKVYVKNVRTGEAQSRSYSTRKLRIQFCKPDDDMMTVYDDFLVPPADDEGKESYAWGWKGTPEGLANCNKHGRSGRPGCGFWARKMKYFSSHGLSFKEDANGNTDPRIKKFANWQYNPDKSYRLIGFEVEPGQPIPDVIEDGILKQNNQGKLYPPKIKMNSYFIPTGSPAHAPVRAPEPVKPPEPEPAPPPAQGRKGKRNSVQV